MGLFSWFRKKRETETKEVKSLENELSGQPELSAEPVKAKPSKVEEAFVAMQEWEGQVQEARRQLQESKVEYEAVTSYLTDIQKIDMVPEEERKTFTEAAEKILLLKEEREKCRSQEIKLSEHHRRQMEQYEGTIPEELKKLREMEQYQSVIKNDMRHLEGEKGVLSFEREEIVEKQANLKKLAVTAVVLVVVLLVLLGVMGYIFEASMAVPFLFAILMGVVSAAYIVAESRKNHRDMVLTEKKMSRAIGLLNKVKIKYVNNTSCLEYACEKLGVDNAMELEYVWKQYLLLKERERQFRAASEQISRYNSVLIEELSKYGVADAEVWIYQPEALVDKKEMVEVRHRLNVRRQKLRERMDYNHKLEEQGIQEAARLKGAWPELS